MQGFGDPAGALLLAGLPPVDLRQEHRHHALEQLRVAPEDMEGLVVDLELLAPVEEHARQGPVEVVAPLTRSEPTLTGALKPCRSPGCGVALADFETRAPITTRG